MRSSLIASVAVLALISILSLGLSGGEQPGKPGKGSLWMKEKLMYTQNILAGLTESDFDKIAKNAAAMDVLTYLEAWARADSPEYKRQVSHFQFANEELIRQSTARNIEGATLAYHQLTVSCVMCHKLVRDSKGNK